MPTVLQIEVPYIGPFGKALTEMSRELAQSIAEELVCIPTYADRQ